MTARLACLASCSFGLEGVLNRELGRLGVEGRADNGSVSFDTDADGLCRANLWLRTADRVWVVLSRFPARTFEELFQGVRRLPWSDLMARRAAFPVEAASHDSQLTSLPALQSVAKKAVVEQLRSAWKQEWLPEDGPPFKIRVSLVKDHCSVTLDSSGRGLHRRGYRKLTAEAPLRETLAAGLVELSYWNPDRLLADPFCGSGTILVEAGWIAQNRAPGLEREFSCEDWPWVGRARMQRHRREAQDQLVFPRLTLAGSDVDPNVLSLARYHVHAAGLRGVSLTRRPVSEFVGASDYGVLITNPPYGERQQDQTSARQLYAELGRVTRDLDTWSIYVLTSDLEFERHFGRRAERHRKLYNGMLACRYYQYPGPRPPDGFQAGSTGAEGARGGAAHAAPRPSPPGPARSGQQGRRPDPRGGKAPKRRPTRLE